MGIWPWLGKERILLNRQLFVFSQLADVYVIYYLASKWLSSSFFFHVGVKVSWLHVVPLAIHDINWFLSNTTMIPDRTVLRQADSSVKHGCTGRNSTKVCKCLPSQAHRSQTSTHPFRHCTRKYQQIWTGRDWCIRSQQDWNQACPWTLPYPRASSRACVRYGSCLMMHDG